MGYAELPAYIKRDMRRTYGEIRVVYLFHGIAELREAVEKAIGDERVPAIEGWALRNAAPGFTARKAAEHIAHRKNLFIIHQRRGDLWLFGRSPA